MLKYVLIPMIPLVTATIAGVFCRYLKEKAAWLTIAGLGTAFLLSISTLFDVMGGHTVNVNVFSWIVSDTFNVSIGIMVDQLTAVMLIVVTTVSFMVHIYSVGYMHGDPGYARFFSYLSLFTFSMLVLVMANNFLQLYVGWELVGLCSYLLIGFWFEKKSANDAAKKAFVVNRVGDFGFGLGIMMIFLYFGTLDYTQVFGAAPQHLNDAPLDIAGLQVGVITMICLLLFCGAMGKSAQLPLHTWLPDAMEGPTPVSALIHAATMVTAGVFMVARCSPLFNLSPTAMATVAIVGGVTAVFAATIGLVQNDIKRIIAYSTCSQLGYMFFACGVGAYTAGIFHLMTHAFFKGLLFLAAGSVIHALSGEQDIRKMGGIRKDIPVTYWTMVIGSLALAGIPPFAGFFSKDEILWLAFTAPGPGKFLWFLGAVGALLTAFYSFRLIFVTFHGKKRLDHHAEEHLHESPWVILGPLCFLATLAIVAGFVGVPHVLGGHNNFASFMAPVLGHHEAGHHPASLELTMMVISVAIATTGILFSAFVYLKRKEIAEAAARNFKPLYNLFYNKYYFDEAYDDIFVNSTKEISDDLWKKADASWIDGVVNGAAKVTQALARGLRRLQTGFVQHYAFGMVTGLFLLITIYLYMK
ncbi:MAG: NADH-quinone oxidoreductase subunit L [Nitrospirota bacterium]|nr:NADH-quinone oxidoreductase subunit L [Nitrospirota bacterium]